MKRIIVLLLLPFLAFSEDDTIDEMFVIITEKGKEAVSFFTSVEDIIGEDHIEIQVKAVFVKKPEIFLTPLYEVIREGKTEGFLSLSNKCRDSFTTFPYLEEPICLFNECRDTFKKSNNGYSFH